jgi:SP family sugar:H+ symporter-like MFS transporter
VKGLCLTAAQAFGTACDVAAAFLVTFVTPYLLPKMGVNIGWIFGSVAAFSIVWGFLFFPELKVSSSSRLSLF